MSMERSRRDYPVKAQRARRHGLFGAPAWYLRFRLRAIVHEIDALEAVLAGEFGVDDLRPLLDDVERLSTERDALINRLARRY